MMERALRTRARADTRPFRQLRSGGLAGALAWCASYATWITLIRLLVLTFTTYFVMTGASSRPARFEDISEAFGANELTLTGLCAIVFVFGLRMMNPITSTTTEEIFTPERIEKSFIPGFFHGAMVASGLILAFLLSGLYRYLGFIIQFEDAHITLPNILIRGLAIAGWVYCEEFVFRGKLQDCLASLRLTQGLSSDPRRARWLAQLIGVLLTGLAYCAIKRLQFDLGWSHLLTLFLASVALSARCLADRDFAGGAGFWAAVLIVYHPILSLPIFGSEFSGIILIKHQAGFDLDPDARDATARLFGGGAGGPLSSLAFQLLLLLDAARGILRVIRSGRNSR